MRYILTLFWAFALGQVVGYLGSSLSSQTYDFVQTTIFSLVVGLFIILLGQLSSSSTEEEAA
ncbi:YjzD family protein [Enterococcus sp. LJL98]